MCGPLAALALTGVAGLMKYEGEKKAAHAREKAFDAERLRQRTLQSEQNDSFQDSLAKTANVTDPNAVAKAAATREGSLVHALAPINGSASYLPGAASAPAIVATAKAAGDTHARADGLSLAHALAALGGTGDQLQELNTGIGRNSEHIGQVGGFARGSAGALDAEMKAAANKGSTLRGVGGLAQQLAMAYLSGGAGGGGGIPGVGNEPLNSSGLTGIY